MSTDSLPSLPSSQSTYIADGRAALSTLATPSRKRYPWKNVPLWSPLHSRLQQLENSSTLITQQPQDSPEIPETLVVASENMRREGNDSGSGGNTPSIANAGRPRLTELR
jgi:hypothetical protein